MSNWKKVDDKPDYVRWSNKTAGRLTLVRASKGEVFVGKWSVWYNVMAQGGLADQNGIGIYNSRAEAVAAARKWMKEHPNGD